MRSSIEEPLSKGLKLVAEYRAMRLEQSPQRRKMLQRARNVLREDRENLLRGPCLPSPAGDRGMQSVDLSVTPLPESKSKSIFAELVSSVTTESVEGSIKKGDVNDKTSIEIDTRIGLAEGERREVLEMNADARLDPPLAQIGFGPGMLIRLSQIGVQSSRDLANADAQNLRSLLGEISQMMDVEVWITSAKGLISEL